MAAVIYYAGLALSGITAFPIESELAFLSGHSTLFPTILGHWITTVYHALQITNQNYPYLAYGTDWLAFGHLVIATVFIGRFDGSGKKYLGAAIRDDRLRYGFSRLHLSRALSGASRFTGGSLIVRSVFSGLSRFISATAASVNWKRSQLNNYPIISTLFR